MLACIHRFTDFFLLFFWVPQLYLWGSPYWVRFLHTWPFFHPTIEVITFSLCRWCMLGVYVASFHPSKTWMSGSFKSVWWIACVHRLDHVNSNGKSSLPEKFSSEEDQTHNAESSRTASPTHLQRAIPAPIYGLISLYRYNDRHF